MMECISNELGKGIVDSVGFPLIGTRQEIRQEIQVRKCNNTWDDK